MTTRRHSPFTTARGLGAAGHGAGHWWAQRVSAVALIPLVIWLTIALTGGAAADHTALKLWLGVPLNAILMVLLLIAAFHHAALGLQVVAEDYIHSRTRFLVVALIHLACITGAVAGIVSVMMLALVR